MTNEDSPTQSKSGSRRYGVYLPLLLTLIGIVSWLVFQTSQLVIEHGALLQLRANQVSTLHTMQKMRKQLETLSVGAAKLAQQGNPNAKLIVDDLHRKGITINPPPMNTAPSR